MLGGGAKSGYNYAATASASAAPVVNSYVLGAAPQAYSGATSTGTRQFTSDATGVIYAATASSTTAPTTTSGSPIGN